nr:DnaA/Hda family protein [Desulfurobacterium sp.]
MSLIDRAFTEKKIEIFRQELSKAKAIFIDDFQAFNSENLESARSFLFVLIDKAITANKIVIATNDTSLYWAGWSNIEERLRQRLLTRGDVRISPPSRDFTACFVETRLKKFGIHIEKEAIEHVLEYDFTNVRDLEALVWNLSVLNKPTITLNDVVFIIGKKFPHLKFSSPASESENTLRDVWEVVVKKFFSDPLIVDEVLKNKISKRSKPRHLSMIQKIFAKVAVEEGYPRADVCKLFNVSSAALSNWLRRQPMGEEARIVEDRIKLLFQSLTGRKDESNSGGKH